MSRGGATWSSPMHAGMQVQQSWTPCWLTPAACLETSTSKTSKCLEARPVRPRVHLPTLSLLPLLWVATVPLVLADTREDAEGKYNSFDDRKILRLDAALSTVQFIHVHPVFFFLSFVSSWVLAVFRLPLGLRDID